MILLVITEHNFAPHASHSGLIVPSAFMRCLRWFGSGSPTPSPPPNGRPGRASSGTNSNQPHLSDMVGCLDSFFCYSTNIPAPRIGPNDLSLRYSCKITAHPVRSFRSSCDAGSSKVIASPSHIPMVFISLTVLR